MNERLRFLVSYIGSAAMVAFLAACLNSPRVATFTCDTPPGASAERCQLADTLAAAPPASADMLADDAASHDPGSLAVALSATP